MVKYLNIHDTVLSQIFACYPCVIPFHSSKLKYLMYPTLHKLYLGINFIILFFIITYNINNFFSIDKA